MKTLLITLSGTHGTGKSTTAGNCYYYLNETGRKLSYIRHQDILIPFGFIIKRGAQLLRLNPLELEKMRPFRILWGIYILLIYVPILGGGIRIRNAMGYSVLCDRYVYDLIVTFRGKDIAPPFESLLPMLLPRPSISFVLDAPTDRILKHRPEHTQDFVEREQLLYLQLSNHFQLHKIDTREPASVVGKKIVSQIVPLIKEPAEAAQC